LNIGLGIEIEFSLDAPDLPLLYFLADIGLNAKLDLVSGGRPFLVLLGLTVAYRSSRPHRCRERRGAASASSTCSKSASPRRRLVGREPRRRSDRRLPHRASRAQRTIGARSGRLTAG
jgi:hypothetical protein